MTKTPLQRKKKPTPVTFYAGSDEKPQTIEGIEQCSVCEDGTAHVVCRDGFIRFSVLKGDEK